MFAFLKRDLERVVGSSASNDQRVIQQRRPALFAQNASHTGHWNAADLADRSAGAGPVIMVGHSLSRVPQTLFPHNDIVCRVILNAVDAGDTEIRQQTFGEPDIGSPEKREFQVIVGSGIVKLVGGINIKTHIVVEHPGRLDDKLHPAIVPAVDVSEVPELRRELVFGQYGHDGLPPDCVRSASCIRTLAARLQSREWVIASSQGASVHRVANRLRMARRFVCV